MFLLLVIEAVDLLSSRRCIAPVLCTPTVAASPAPPRAVGGRLDVSSWDFAAGNVPLRGEWELYFGQLLDPHHLPPPPPGNLEATGATAHAADGGAQAASARGPLYASVPGSWTSVRTDEGSLPRFGAATYRLLITGLPGTGSPLEFDSAAWGLKIPYARTAYRLWVNGRLAASNGTVSLRPEETRPHYKPMVVPLPGVPGSTPENLGNLGTGSATAGAVWDGAYDTIELVLQVSNGHFRAGGIPKNVVFGPFHQVMREHHERLLFQMFVTGAIALMALYFALVHLWRPGDLSISSFALLSGSLAVRSFFTGELPHAVFMPDFPWHLLLRIEYVTSYVGPMAFMLFLHALYPEEVSRTIRNVWIALGGAGAVLSVALPVRYSSMAIPYYTVLVAALIPYICWVLIQAARKKRQGSGLTLAGGFVFVVSSVLAMFHYNQLWIDFDWAPFGLFWLLLAQAFALSRRSALAFRETTELARENARLLEQTRRRLAERNRLYRLLAQQDEQTRRSIAEVLHGRVQARLFAASQSAMQAAAAVEDDAQEAIKLMHFVHDTVEEVRQQEIRDVSHRLHPPAIRAGLVGALDSLCSGRHDDLNIDFSVDPALTFLDNPGGLRLKEWWQTTE